MHRLKNMVKIHAEISRVDGRKKAPYTPITNSFFFYGTYPSPFPGFGAGGD